MENLILHGKFTNIVIARRKTYLKLVYRFAISYSRNYNSQEFVLYTLVHILQ